MGSEIRQITLILIFYFEDNPFFIFTCKQNGGSLKAHFILSHFLYSTAQNYGTIFARGKTSCLPNVVAAKSLRWDENRNRGKDKVTESRGELDVAISWWKYDSD